MFCCLLKSVVEERFLREDPQYAAYTQNICELAASDQSTKHGRRTEAHFDVSDKDLALIGVGTFLALSLVTGKPEVPDTATVERCADTDQALEAGLW
jgi:hypothetical protein